MMAPAVAVKVPVVAPAPTLIEAGTVNPALSLESVIVAPPDGAGEERVTVQAAVPLLGTLAGEQPTEVTVAWPTRENVACCELLL